VRAAAFVIAVLVATASAACGEDDRVAIAPTSAERTTTSTTVEPTPEPTTTTSAVKPTPAAQAASAPTRADDAARAWVAALARGETDRAWAVLAARSRAAVGGRQRFNAMQAELANRWGPWHRGTGVRYAVVSVPGTSSEKRAVVVLTGTITRNGVQRRISTALPVRTANGVSKVDPLVDLGRVEFQPPSGSKISATPTFDAYVPATRTVHFVIDSRGYEVPALTGADGDQQRARLEPGPAFSAGHHSLTVVISTADGAVSTKTADYTVDPAAATKCESVGFTPNSEDAASEIEATGLPCDEARQFVRRAGAQTSSGGPDQVTVDGYNCVRTSYKDEPLPRSAYECKNGAKRVTFVRS